MGEPMPQRIVDEADYLVAERDAEVRHEYVDGVLFAMTGASRAHNLLATSLSSALHIHLRGSGCRVFSSDMKVRLAEGRRYYYPDVFVSRGDARDEPDDHTETRPVLVVEILSPSTFATDQREKRIAYQTIPSLSRSCLRTSRASPGSPVSVVAKGRSAPETIDLADGRALRRPSDGVNARSGCRSRSGPTAARPRCEGLAKPAFIARRFVDDHHMKVRLADGRRYYSTPDLPDVSSHATCVDEYRIPPTTETRPKVRRSSRCSSPSSRVACGSPRGGDRTREAHPAYQTIPSLVRLPHRVARTSRASSAASPVTATRGRRRRSAPARRCTRSPVDAPRALRTTARTARPVPCEPRRGTARPRRRRSTFA